MKLLSELRNRLSLVYAAIRYLFTGQGLELRSGIIVVASDSGVTMTYSRRLSINAPWEVVDVTFDNKEAAAYINGEKV